MNVGPPAGVCRDFRSQSVDVQNSAAAAGVEHVVNPERNTPARKVAHDFASRFQLAEALSVDLPERGRGISARCGNVREIFNRSRVHARTRGERVSAQVAVLQPTTPKIELRQI